MIIAEIHHADVVRIEKLRRRGRKRKRVIELIAGSGCCAYGSMLRNRPFKIRNHQVGALENRVNAGENEIAAFFIRNSADRAVKHHVAAE